MKKTVFTAMIAAVAALAMPGKSQAAYTITISDGLSAPVVFVGGPNAALANTVYNYGTGLLQVGAISFGPASPGNGKDVLLTTIAASVTLTGTITAKTITISLASDGFNMIADNGTVNTAYSSTVLKGTASGSSTVNGVIVAGSTINLGVNPGPASQGGDSSTVANFGANPITFGNTMVLNLAASSANNGTIASTTLSSEFVAAPAPPALLLAAFGIPAMGLVRRWTRKVKSTGEMAIAA
jgi:hypothetical protein